MFTINFEYPEDVTSDVDEPDHLFITTNMTGIVSSNTTKSFWRDNKIL
jgi:hypothetical protein